MKDKDIEYISMIAECGNLTKAAEKLYIAQPSLTQFVHRLEQEYGAPFFRRTKEGLRLTEEGKHYIETGQNMLAEYENMKRAIGIAEDRSAQAEAGIASFLGTLLLPKYIAGFKEKFPDTVLHVIDGASDRLVDLLKNGRLDFAILHAVSRDEELVYLPVKRDRFLLAVSQDDPDHLRASEGGTEYPVITKKVMAEKSFVMTLSNPVKKQVSDRIFASAGVEPRIGQSSTNLLSSFSLAEQGLGATFISESFAHYYGKLFKLKYFSLPESWNGWWDICIAYRKDDMISPVITGTMEILTGLVDGMKEVFPE